MIGSIYRNLGIAVRADYGCVVTFFTPLSIESNNSKCCPALPEACVPAYADIHAEPFYNNIMLTTVVVVRGAADLYP